MSIVYLAMLRQGQKQDTTRPGTFKKDHVPWNKGVKGLHLNPDTEFADGKFVGEEHPSWQGGVQVTKRDGVFLWDGNGKRVRRSRKVYQETYGEIPKGYVIYHRDGNKFNDKPINLEAIPRAELVKRNAVKNKKEN